MRNKTILLFSAQFYKSFLSLSRQSIPMYWCTIHIVSNNTKTNCCYRFQQAESNSFTRGYLVTTCSSFPSLPNDRLPAYKAVFMCTCMRQCHDSQHSISSYICVTDLSVQCPCALCIPHKQQRKCFAGQICNQSVASLDDDFLENSPLQVSPTKVSMLQVTSQQVTVLGMAHEQEGTWGVPKEQV